MEKVTTVYLIRHSEQLKICNEKNVREDEQISNEKIILSVDGELKALKMSKMEEMTNIDELWSSNYVRAISTAKYIANRNNIKINIEEDLGERKLGDQKALQELGKGKELTYTQEQLLNEKLKNIGGESREEVNRRMSIFLNRILDEKEGLKVALVSHGAAIKYLLMNWCKLDEDCRVKYKDKKIDVRSPGIIKMEFIKRDLKDINVIL